MGKQSEQGAVPVDQITSVEGPPGPTDEDNARSQPRNDGATTARHERRTDAHGHRGLIHSELLAGRAGDPVRELPAVRATTNAESEYRPPTFRSLMGLSEPHHGLRVIADHRRNGYVRRGAGPWTRLDSPKASALVAAGIHETTGVQPRQFDVQEVIEQLKMAALLAPKTDDVWLRVACLPNGDREIYLGDPEDTRVRISPGQWRLIHGSQSEVNFYETQATAPFVIPERGGTTKLLEPYLNLDPVGRALLIVWITFVLGHAKQAGVAFPLLVLGGEQGAGKTTLCHWIQLLTDPSSMGVQSFPRSERDFAVTTQASSVVFYDNVRLVGRDASDMLCRAASGGMFAIRKLFSDAGVMSLPVHGAIVLNGIHEFIVQPDLAQRSMRLNLKTMDEKNRRSERAMREQFALDLPRILGALLDVIAGILTRLRDVEPEHPERMIDFVRWMAAYEQYVGAPNAPYQREYSNALRLGMRSSLEESPLAAAVFELMDELGRPDGSWTPSELYAALGKTAGRRAANSRDWPLNPSAMSKRLKVLQAALRRQGIDIHIGRRQERRITITRLEVPTDE